MNPQLIRALPEHEPIFVDLLDRYAHDFSAFHQVAFGADGRFVYTDLPSYWTDPRKFPYLIQIEDSPAGFALVKRSALNPGANLVWDMSEFYVTPEFRRCGVGLAIARDIWAGFPGQWQIRVMESNHAALNFWAKAIRDLTGKATVSAGQQHNGISWRVFTFENQRPEDAADPD